mgnify:CR=1 FL=1
MSLVPASKASSYQNLSVVINKDAAFCANQSSSHVIQHMLSNNGQNSNSAFLQSKHDAQMILHIPFSAPVGIRYIKLLTPAQFAKAKPKTIKLFVNRPALDFNDVNQVTPVQQFELTEDSDDKQIYELKFVKFLNVTDLTVCIFSCCLPLLTIIQKDFC